MPTVAVNLDTTQYVKVNTSFNPIMLQAHRDSVRIALSPAKPAKGNSVFHVIGGDDVPMHIGSPDTNIWALAVTDNSSLVVSETDIPSVKYGRSPSIDAAGRLRVSRPHGIIDTKNITSRNRNQWNEVLSGVILGYTGKVGAGFDVGSKIRGTLPTGFIAIGIVTADSGTELRIDCDHNDFQVGDTITQQDGVGAGTTATLTTTNTGSDIQHDYDTASVILKVGTAATDSATRQSHRAAAYVPGKGQNPSLTFKSPGAKTNVVIELGVLTDTDGLGMRQTENGVDLIIRSSTSGSPVDLIIPQDEWNIDRFDGGASGGPNPSGITLDLTKVQYFACPYLWQGVGPVDFGFIVENELIYCHQHKTANVSGEPYIRTPTLPVRYKIYNTGVTASPTQLKEYCSTVSSEGGYDLPGLEFSIPEASIATRAVTTRTPIFALRLKNEFPAGKPNARMVKFLSAGGVASTNNAVLEIAHIHEAVDIIATWNDVGGGSSLEYSTDISAITGRPAHVIEHLELTTAQGNKSQGSTVKGDLINLHGLISQNHDSTDSQLFVIYATSETGTSDVRTHMTVIEFD
jgi:hypothetical protein